MREPLLRRIGLAIVLAVIWLCVLAWAAGMTPLAPLAPRHSVTLHGVDFRPAD